MKHFLKCFICVLLVSTFFLGGCVTAQQTQTTTISSAVTPVSTVQPLSVSPSMWLDSAIPADIQAEVKQQAGFTQAAAQSGADLTLQVQTGTAPVNTLGQVQWIYALEAPFPTVTDGITAQQLQNFWTGNGDSGLPFDTLQVTSETRAVFDELWGTSSATVVQTVTADQLSTNDFQSRNTWAIVPFDQITPRWKVIQIDGLSPMDKPLDTAGYALKANFILVAKSDNANLAKKGKALLSAMPSTNRDESKMTVLMMTGTTALVRAIAYKMEIKGLDYPIEKVKDWFKDADLIHVSNEVAFDPDCPFPDYSQHGLQFCSAPKYLQTLQDLGVNVVELTGNHEDDYGDQYFSSSIDTYKSVGMSTFGGGKTPAEAQAPLKLESNGNKIAFIGCNPNGPQTDWATDTRAGSAQCDYDYFDQQISDLKAQGYVVVATFQQDEIYTYLYGDKLAGPFRDAAKAGADIVSGSEAHYAMGFQFVGNSYIHYGLGNFLFDQMTYQGVGDDIRREFIDRHIIYNGKYLGTELLTAYLVDWAQPNPMTAEQRTSFLTDVFDGSKWSETNEGN